MLDFFLKIIRFFNIHKIDYMLSGSVALSIYTLPRATRDFDLVVHLKEENVAAMIDYFNTGYYIDKDSIMEAIKHKSIFNIIDHQSGFKADFIILKNEPFRQAEFERRIQTDFYGTPVYVVTAEDLLLAKLIWIQEVQSNLQKDDIINLAALDNLDWRYIHSWINILKLNTFNLFNLEDGHSETH